MFFPVPRKASSPVISSLIGRNDFCFHETFVGQIRAFCSETGKFSIPRAFRKTQHIIVVRILDKSAALCQNPVQSSVAHKETSFGFLFLKFQDTLKVRPDGGEKVEIIGDILSFIKSVFRQKYRKLGLNTKTWPKWFLEKIIVARDFSV